MDYKKTVLVGRTAFPMKASLVQREPVRLQKWQQERFYDRLQKKGWAEDRPVFVLHDGPPYANGHIHIGTAMNKVLKDVVVRAKSMDGYVAPYVPGWDMHGLPIELQAIRDARLNRHNLSAIELRKRCREYAFSYMKVQREEFRRLGVWGDWENPYLTLKPEYEAKQIEIFGQMALNGHIYKGKKPVYWCADCETALAEAEIEYHDHQSDSIYVRFAIVDSRGLFPVNENNYVIIWTTTPWTLPANLAICLHPSYKYVRVKVDDNFYILAEELLSAVAETLGWSETNVVDRWSGNQLEGVITKHPFIDRESPLILGDHVTLDAGTGCVHTAPGHGMEDYEVGLRYKLDVYAPVDNAGRFTAEAGKYAGMRLAEANKAIVEDMHQAGSLLYSEKLDHQYPHCWRCKNPIVYRATEQWFASVDGFRQQALQAINEVQWIPNWGINRITGMVAERHDWCISRQRVWGVPIPIFFCRQCGQYLVTEESIAAVANLFRKEGSDAWFTHTAEEILPADTSCPHCGGTEFTKEKDTMDVWFDSGSSHAAVCAQREELHWPADMYLEGSDQHRGWFQSSLLTSVAAYGKAPYRSVLTHGFIVDAEGRKMSKSIGNVVTPDEVIKKYGADILRLWVSSADYKGDVSISSAILDQMSEVYRRIRNTARFLLANTSDFNRATDSVPYEQLNQLDRWALLRAEQMHQRVIEAYRNCEFHVMCQAVHNFCAVDMGGFYLDVLKDRLYCDQVNSQRRRSAQTAMCDILLTLVKLIAPVLVFTADEVWEYLPEQVREEESVHLTRWRPVNEQLLDVDLAKRWDVFNSVRKVAARALEKARADKQIGSGNEATLHLYVESDVQKTLLSLGEELESIFIVSKVNLHDPTQQVLEGTSETDQGITAVVTRAAGDKCDRCWRYSEAVSEVGTDHDHLCSRCAQVIEQI